MKSINKVKTQTQDVEHHNGKTYYRCCVCGRSLFRKIVSHGHVYCAKHCNQIKKYGKTLDTNPRTIQDKNEIIIDDKIARIKIYNKNSEQIAEAIIDAEDVANVQYIKWKLSANGYVMHIPKFKDSHQSLSRVILHTHQMVDHINHNTLDNRKCNLRIVTHSQNRMNANSKGVSKLGNKWYAHIKINQHKISLGTYVDQEEALYARWYAEQLLFKEFAYPKPEPEILSCRKSQIQEYVSYKVQRL